MHVELLESKPWNTRVELANGILGYLEIFHNRSDDTHRSGDAQPDCVCADAGGWRLMSTTPMGRFGSRVLRCVRVVRR